MPDLKRITTINGTTYDLVDQGARDLISELEGYTEYLGVTTTPIEDGSTVTEVVITGVYNEVTPVGTENPKEEGWYELDSSGYVLTEDTTVVQGKDYYTDKTTVKKGDIVNYGSKEFIFNGTAWNEFGDLSGLGALAFKNSASGSYTPYGSVSTPTFTGTAGNVEVSGSISSGNVTISKGTGTANYTPEGTVSQPTFSGSELTSTGTYTPSGSVSNVELNTDTVPNVTGVGTLPNLTMTVDNETLQFGWSQGTLPTLGEAKTFATTVKTQPAFTGTQGNLSVTGTPEGTVTQPTFTGTGAELKGTIADGSISATGTFTPEGTLSQPTFTGTAATIEVE